MKVLLSAVSALLFPLLAIPAAAQAEEGCGANMRAYLDRSGTNYTGVLTTPTGERVNPPVGVSVSFNTMRNTPKTELVKASYFVNAIHIAGFTSKELDAEAPSLLALDSDEKLTLTGLKCDQGRVVSASLEYTGSGVETQYSRVDLVR